MSIWRQTKVILWKNFASIRRNRSDLVSEFLVPLVCVILIYSIYAVNKKVAFYNIPILLPLPMLGITRKFLMSFVSEKAEKYKETLKIMGLKQTSYFLGWFLTCHIRMILVWILVCLCLGSIRDYYTTTDNLGTLCIAYLFYCISAIHQTLALSTFFDKPKIAGEIGIFVQALTGFLYYITSDSSGSAGYYFICLFPQAAVNYAVQSQNINYKDQEQNFSINDALIMLIVDSVIYMVLYLYLDEVLPNEYGVKKHPLFFIKNLFQSSSRPQSDSISEGGRASLNDPLLDGSHHVKVAHIADKSSAIFHEPFANEKNLRQTIVIEKLVKQFGSLRAVNEISLSLYQSQIFCLLGHNGAGKTTTISLLTGLIEKTKGKVKIYDLDLKQDIDEIRKYTGLCSQKDILYEDLTVEEHLRMISIIKGVEESALSSQIEYTLEKCGLVDDRKKPTKILNGGGKRKLSLGMALIGGSKVVFLDEPTSGLDPISRRKFWDILETLRNEERTIILTTHYLDEADILADRIGVMAKGQLLTVGTPNFIKKNFGEGYRVIVSPNPDVENSEVLFATREKANTLEIFKSHIPELKLNNQTTNDNLSLILPFASQGKFSALFKELEENPNIRINLEINSLEDAFVNIGMDEEKFLHPEKFEKEQDEKFTNFENIKVPDCLTRKPTYRFLSQVTAIFLRKLFVTIRTVTLLITYGFPVLLIILSTVIAKKFILDEPKLPPSAKAGIYSAFLTLAYSLNSSIYVGLPVMEKELNLKYALNVMGCRNLPYWIGTFIFDYFCFYITLIILFISLASFNLEFITDYFGVFVGMMTTFGSAFLAFTYLCGFLFEKSDSAYKGFPLLNYFVFYSIPYAILGICREYQAVCYVTEIVFFIFSPIFTLNRAVSFISGQLDPTQPSRPLVQYGENLIWVMLGQTIVYFGLTLALETLGVNKNKEKKIKKRTHSLQERKSSDMEGVDIEDVSKEFDRVTEDSNVDPIKAVEIKKSYPNGFQALRDVSFGVERGQIFGLLGPNGAGKSTTFNILTALIPKSSGSAQLKNTEVSRDIIEVFQDVGICPQFDCLWENLTPIEHLRLFGRMKGLRKKDLDESVNYFIQTMQLESFIGTKAGNLSGGNKRKLCVANALIGGPDLLFFDEPSTGLDPIARRFLWNTLSQSLSSRDSSIVLTTHSMGEAESLCKKIGILINGKFRCFGSTQHLKTKYGTGYTLSLKSKSGDTVSNLVRRVFPGSKLMEDNKDGFMNYQIPLSEFSFYKAFNFIETELKSQNLIQDFSICQTSLEQVFLFFSKFQKNIEIV